MLKNFFLTALRSFIRHKIYTLINVSGLGISIGCAILIFSLVKYNLSFDNYHPEGDRIYRIITELSFEKKLKLPGVPYPLPGAFISDHPFAEKIATVMRSKNEEVSLPGANGSKKYEENIAYTEPSMFELFHLPLVKGDRSALNKPDAVFISESKAKSFFGESDPMGKTIRIANKANFTVMGILKDRPANTDRTEEIYVSFRALKTLQPWQVQDNNWLNVNSDMQCFVRLKKGVAAADVNKAFIAFIRRHYPEKDAKDWNFALQPLADIHLNTDYGASVGRQSLVALSCIGLFVVLAACINFVNLATAQAISRSKEIGVRKVLGSSRPQLFWQFITETAMIGLMAALIGLTLAELSLPFVNQMFGTEMELGIFTDIYLPVFLLLLLAVIVFFSGIYPGMVMAGIEPVLALKGKLSHGSSGSMSMRKVLVVIQFAISQLLIIGTIVIVNQMRYSQKADMGFTKDGIVLLPVPDNQPSKLSTLKSQILDIPGLRDATFCYAPPAHETASSGSITFGSRPEPEKFQISFRAGDENFVPFFDLKILAGRNVLRSDTVREFLVNQSTVKMLGLKSDQEALGKTATINGYRGNIVGVIKDFHNKSFHAAIEPLAITTFFVWYERAAVKIDAENMKNTLDNLQAVWQRAYPNHLYKQEFLDDRISKRYETDTRMMILIQIFTTIAVFIGCMSLYGLVSFMAAQKKREVAVRKVLGATVSSIVLLFAKEFGKLMVIAFMLAAPVGWYVMRTWLNNFAYRIDIGAGIFVIALLITSLVVTLTIGYKSVITALADPSKSLRSE